MMTAICAAIRDHILLHSANGDTNMASIQSKSRAGHAFLARRAGPCLAQEAKVLGGSTMTARERSNRRKSGGAGLPTACAPLDDDFFNYTRDPPPQEEDLLEMAPRDPVLERKMSLAVRARRWRFTCLVMGAVGCAALLLVVASVMRLAPSPRPASASVVARAPAVGSPATREAHLVAAPAMSPHLAAGQDASTVPTVAVPTASAPLGGAGKYPAPFRK